MDRKLKENEDKLEIELVNKKLKAQIIGKHNKL